MAPKPLSATERMARSRETTKAVVARELIYAGVLSRVWPSYITTPNKLRNNPSFPYLLCVKSPAGLLVWRLTEDEAIFFDWLEERPNDGADSEDKAATLYALASGGWS